MIARERHAGMPVARSQATTHLIHLAFVLIGVVTTLLDPMLPVLSNRWSLNDAQAGYLFTAQFIGSTLGVLLSGLAVHHWGYRSAIVSGMAAMAVGATILNSGLWALGLTAVFIYGIGLGLAIPACNLLTAEINPAERAAALSWLNFSWGLGAAACGFAVRSAIGQNRTSFFLYALAAALLVVSACFFCSWVVLPAAPLPVKSIKGASVWRNPFVFALGSLFFLYVGSENSVGGWIATQASRIQVSSGTLWATTPSVFWGALLAGRALATSVLRAFGDTRTAIGGLILSTLGLTGLLAAHTLTVLLISIVVIGLGLAPLFPIYISLLSQRFGDAAPRVGGLMFALAGLGGAILPWTVGFASTKFGGLRAGLVVPWAGCLTMLLLYAATKRSAASAAPTV